ncbi:MAG: type II secretion system GspH family protein [Planctomycetota bacterium]|nr:type II secretion system GspH family protein [Planctomycetota bacterium]
MFGTERFMRPVRRGREGGYTLTEILVVIMIAGILAGLLLPSFAEARRESKISECHHNLQQIYKALFMWDMDHDRNRENYIDRLTNLQEEKYIGGDRVFLCPLDRYAGRQGGYPDGTKDGPLKFSENDERPTGPGMAYCSYMYEFSGAACRDESYWLGAEGLCFPKSIPAGKEKEAVDSNGDGKLSWAEIKSWQLEYGDQYLLDYGQMETDALDPSQETVPYDRHWFPILRCFWHETVENINTTGTDISRNRRGAISNVNMDGGLFLSGPKWEVIAAYKMFATEEDDDWEDDDDWDE